LKRIAIFTEGQTEYIFIRNAIFKIFDANKFSIECFKLHSNSFQVIPYSYSSLEPLVHFTIVNVGNDEKVLSIIKERYTSLRYDLIIGLRDMYSRLYREKSSNKVDEKINIEFIMQTKQTISTFDTSKKTKIFFAIMEIESWILGMNSIFTKYNSILTEEKILHELKIDLRKVDPEEAIFHPSTIINDILLLVNDKYDKSLDMVEKITSFIELSDLNDLYFSNKCKSFQVFANNLLNETTEIFNSISPSLGQCK
jgi:hypothetical protein